MSDVLASAEALIDEVSVPEAIRGAARDHLSEWLTQPRYADYRPQIEALIEAGRGEELVDAFRQVLPFGTGGRRGRVGVGPNRMNPHAVATSVQGHAQWLHQRFAGEAVRVVIAYDVRRFDDVGGIYDAGRPSPIHGLSSRDLAEIAARIYAANGVEAHILPRDSDAWLSTPELSFTIRALSAHGGLNVSASHNPPDDNGVKVYESRGAQLVPPDDESLLQLVQEVRSVQLADWDEAVAQGRIRFLEPEIRAAYLEVVSGVAGVGARRIPVMYTPLHGTGVVDQALRRAGFRCTVFEPQATPDGRFPTVPGGVANPENPEVMAAALAEAGDAQLVFGTDPDADRLGCEVRHGGGWVHLTGNDIAALVVYQATRRQVHRRRRPLVIVTEVTSTLVGRVARAAGAVVVDDLLVGFKHIAQGLRQLEVEGSWRGIRADEVAFVAGGEESHGVLMTDQIRDKDAAGGAVALAVLADEAAARGQTLIDVLRGLEHYHGLIRNGQISVRFEGATGAQRLSELLEALRAEPPTQLAGRAVLETFDHRDEQGRFGPFRSGSDRDARNVLVYHLSGAGGDAGARVILRPSGTEPKLKVYLEIQGAVRLGDAGREQVEASLDALRAAMAQRVGG